MSDPLALVGRLVIDWNFVEERLFRFIWLYLNTDDQTLEVITTGMRAVDGERLLKRLVAVKEPRDDVRDEISFVLKCCQTMRKNRNDVAHAFTPTEGPSAKLTEALANLAKQGGSFISYLDNLAVQIRIQVNDRNDRMSYEDEYSDPYETIPIPPFEAPARPESPVALKLENLN